MRDGSNEGMQHFDAEIERLIRSGVIDLEMGLSHASNVGNLRLQIADLLEHQGEESAFGAENVLAGAQDNEIER
jgi:twitching motility protein PilT